MIYFIIGTLLWGTSFIAGKIAFQTIDPTLVVILRLTIASIVMLPVTGAFLKKRHMYQITKKDFLLLILLGILTYPATFMLEFTGLSLTSVSSATTIIGVGPVMVALIGALFFNEKPAPLVYVLGCVSFVGIALMVGNADMASISYLGCLIMFLSTIVVAFWVHLSTKVLGKIPPVYYTPLCIQFGTLFGAPILSVFVKTWHVDVTIEGIAAIVYLSIFCSILASMFWNKGLQTYDSSRSGIFLSLEPVFSLLFAVVLLHEKISLLSAVGVGLVIISATICMVLPTKDSESEEEVVVALAGAEMDE